MEDIQREPTDLKKKLKMSRKRKVKNTQIRKGGVGGNHEQLPPRLPWNPNNSLEYTCLNSLTYAFLYLPLLLEKNSYVDVSINHGVSRLKGGTH